MKKLLTLFSTLSMFPLLGQLTISCENNEKKELSKILNSIKPLKITEINEDELKTWCINWIKYVEKEDQPSKLDNEQLKNIILTNLAIYATAHLIEETTTVKNVIKQLHKNHSNAVDAVISALQKMNEEKIVKALMFVFLIYSIDKKDSAFECEFAPLQNEKDKQFVLKVKKADWEDIETETNEAFVQIKEEIVETSSAELLKKLKLPSELEQKAEKVKKLIKHVTFNDVKKVYDNIANEKTFTINFNS